MAQTTPDQKPTTPDNQTATTDNTAAPENTEKKGILHKLDPFHRGPKKAKAEKPPKPAKAAPPEEKKAHALEPGPTASVQIEGNNFNMGAVATYNFDIGYQINEHVSADIGLPLFTTRTPFPVVAHSDFRYTTIIGAPYVDVRYDTKRGDTNITSILTCAAGFNMVKTYSDGRATAQWFNHFDRNYQVLSYDVKFTPFLNFDVATGTIDRQVMPRPYELARPYETLGQIGSGEVGGAFTFMKKYRLEGSAYGLAPLGPQKVYSRLVSPDSLLGWTGAPGNEDHNRFWDEFFETGGELVNTYGAGPSRIAKDNGFGMYLSTTRWKNFDLQLGYTRSVHYDYGSAFIMLRYNFTGILRNLTIGE
jgi:hypothetical protein